MNTPRLFRFLLRLLPFDFRFDYGKEMEQVFHEQRRSAQSRSGRARIWATTIRDFLKLGPREHLSQLRQDVVYAGRGMRREPMFVVAAVLTLAAGIGAKSAMFSVLHAVLLKPLPYSQPDRLVAVWNRWDGTSLGAHSDPEYLDLSERSRTMDLAAAVQGTVNIVGNGTADSGDPERIPAGYMSTNALRVLGIQPTLGRGFLPEEELQGRDNVVVLTDSLWRRRFDASASVIGRTVLVDGRRSEIIGVLPADARLPIDFGAESEAEIVVPLTFNRTAPRNKRGGHYLHVYGRLQDGYSVEQANAEMAMLLSILSKEYPSEYDQGNFATFVRPLRADLLGDSRPTLTILAISVGLILLLACANVANLMLARGEARRSELAVRTALGASRFRITRQLVTEALLLSAVGATAGLLFAYGCLKFLLLWLAHGASTLPRLGDISINFPVVIFTALVAIIAALIFGFAPALPLSRLALAETLNEGGRDSGGRVRPRVRKVLVAAQVTIATVLLVASGLLLKSFVKVLQQPTGIASERILTFRVSLPESRYPGLQEVSGFYTRLLDEIASLPGVQRAGASTGLPMAYVSGDWGFDIEGRPRVNGKRPGRADWYVVTPGYFEGLGVKLIKGRLPQASDTEQAAPTIYLNETAASSIFRGEDPIGKRVRLSNTTGAEQPWRTVAGVVADVRQHGLDSPANPEMFIPYRQFLHFSAGTQARDMTIVVRAAMEPTALMPSIRAELSKLDGEIPAADVRDMETVIAESTADRKMLLSLIAGFGWIAIVLAVIGVYGVMDYTVLQRRREMGVRIALGATRGAVLQLVLREGMRLVAIGIAAGLVLAAFSGSLLASMLYEVKPRDMMVYIGAAAILGFVSLGATYIPAFRASRVTPMSALRNG